MVSLRPATGDDYEFLARVYASTREAELAPVPWSDEQKRAFLAQQFAAQTSHYAAQYAGASFDVVLVDGDPAGRLIVRRDDAAVHIVDIALLPEHRSRGIGTGLLRSLADEADRRAVALSIYVEINNPALRLYQRLGFEAVQQ